MEFLNQFFSGEMERGSLEELTLQKPAGRISSRRFRYKRRLEAGEVLNIQSGHVVFFANK